MSAISHPEYQRQEHGPFPFEIFGYEPALAEGREHPIPTRVRLVDHNVLETTEGETTYLFEQELSSEGRLVSTVLNGAVILRRTWSDDGSFTERNIEGKQTTVTRQGGHEWLIEVSGGEQAEITEQLASDGSGARRIITIHFGKDEEVIETNLDQEGRVITERTWNNLSEWQDGFFRPIDETAWEYDPENRLSLVRSSSKGANGHPREEQYRRSDSNKLRVVAFLIPEPDPLIAVDQEREYDSSGRIEVVRSLAASVDGSGPPVWTAELSYS
jgi:hypothetical protein